MIGQWKISSWPQCKYHLFLSHCSENRESLALPVYEELKKQQLIPWIDQHDYPLGRNSCEALRTEILCCRHVVYLITEEYLEQGRGWTAIERSLAHLVQENLCFPSFGELLHVELPLVFLPPDSNLFLRSAWQEIKNKGIVCPPELMGTKSAISWAANKINTFVINEEKWANKLAEQIEHTSDLKQLVEAEPHLKRRLIAADPPSLILP